jgi:aminoglycoside phosphotransferase family enzyme/predicted kinase
MDLKADLSRPEAYGSLLPQTVDLIETHVSWVFILERDVFKLKKPVNFGFLDFRTLDARKSACDAEVRLNARLAPGVYLGVAPVRRSPGGAHVIDSANSADGPVVDWAVHMARLSDECRADVLLAKGALHDGDIDAIAERISAFHGEATGGASAARFGSIDAIRRNVDENFAQAREAASASVGAERADEIARWQLDFLAAHAERFARRAAEGRVRECHGDLRLEHVYLGVAACPTVIDCIEFNDRFRFGDTCSDVAFLSMDLAAHGRVDLAERFLARYARASDDFDLYEVVDFYESYRAYVRGKIAALRASDPGLDARDRERAEREARRHFLLALAAPRRPAMAPILVAVGGTIASGKSTVAEHLGAALSAPVLEADRTRKAMLGVAPTHPLDEDPWRGAYDPAVTDRVYEELLRRADVVLASGRPVVVDASFRSREMRRRVGALAHRHGVRFDFVECKVDPAVCRSRLAARAAGRQVSDGRLAIFDAFQAGFEPVSELGPDEHTILDTSRPFEETASALGARVAGWPPRLVG